MGGKAFLTLGDVVCPRMSPQVYKALKTQLEGKLKSLYNIVETPPEAPEKPGHGDIDFLVYGPTGDFTCAKVKETLGATHAIIMEGNHTSNYAVPSNDHEGCFHQVDVHVCKDKDELDRTVFFHGYGDLGMILGLLARSKGLSLGTNGLKIQAAQADVHHPASFPLSSDFTKILTFFGLSMNDWKRGFSTQLDIFRWVSTSRFFDPHRMKDPKGRLRARQERAMYQAYLEWAYSLSSSGRYETTESPLEKDAIIAEALDFFDKRAEFDGIVAANKHRVLLKERFSGQKMMKWTGLSGPVVGQIMQEIRSMKTEEEIVATNEDELRELACLLRERLFIRNIAPH